MSRTRASAVCNPLSLAFWRSERGFVSLGGAILIGASPLRLIRFPLGLHRALEEEHALQQAELKAEPDQRRAA